MAVDKAKETPPIMWLSSTPIVGSKICASCQGIGRSAASTPKTITSAEELPMASRMRVRMPYRPAAGVEIDT